MIYQSPDDVPDEILSYGATPKLILVERLARRDGSLCHYCGLLLYTGQVLPLGDKPPHDRTQFALSGGQAYWYPTVDHVLALANGGSNAFENLVLSCSKCNFDKSDMDAAEFRALQSRKGT